ncbi:MAG: zf-HC2 domain-containing protein [Bacillus sp. (in: Bacteria)]|nr:zf-HC2 domain-containing protein [Bacillus sp. (in: firmicutes)]
MSKKLECAVFKDLYELYQEGELEPESMAWMEQHEMECSGCLEKEEEGAAVLRPSEEDYEKIKSIRILTIVMYGFFAVVSLWMSIWYFW